MFQSIFEFNKAFSTDKGCRDYLSRLYWSGVIKCPYCVSRDIYTYENRPSYRCRNCTSHFRVTTGTIFENSNIPLHKWFLAIYMICSDKKGVSSIQLGKDLKISQHNAWVMAHKIRSALRNAKTKETLLGIVEVDETYVGGKPRRGGLKRGRGTTKTPVFGMLERDGTLHIMPVSSVDKITLQTIIKENIAPGSIIMSDEWKAYSQLNKIYIHKIVTHATKQYARFEDGLSIHVNSLEGAWGWLKRSFKGVYHRPSPKYLYSYCGEFEFKYNNRDSKLHINFRKALQQSRVNFNK